MILKVFPIPYWNLELVFSSKMQGVTGGRYADTLFVDTFSYIYINIYILYAYVHTDTLCCSLSCHQLTGQPVLIGGTMGTCSYVLTGTEQGMQETFGSTCHGAVSTLSDMSHFTPTFTRSTFQNCTSIRVTSWPRRVKKCSLAIKGTR